MDWFLLRETRAGSAAYNMAVDQHLLELLDRGTIDRPVLRIYTWEGPTLSFGYHQRWQKTVVPDALKKHQIALVRRLTGGRAVLHDHGEITYSVAAPIREPFAKRVSHNYKLIGAALERFTNLDGVSGVMTSNADDVAEIKKKRHLPCFASLSQSEIETGGRKLIGSAQKLGERSFVQHGSIPIIHRLDVLNEITGSSGDMSGLMTSMSDHYARIGSEVPDQAVLVDRLIQSFIDVFGMNFTPLESKDLPDQAEVRALMESRFLDDAWTYRK